MVFTNIYINKKCNLIYYILDFSYTLMEMTSIRKRGRPRKTTSTVTMMTNEEQEQTSVNVVRRIQLRRLCDNSRNQYGKAMGRFLDFLKDHGRNEDLDERGHIKLPVKWTTVQSYLTEMIDENESRVPPKFISFSIMNGFNASIVEYYKLNNMLIDFDLKRELDQFLDGYKKMEADRRQNLQMKTIAGKSPLPREGNNKLFY